MAIPAIQQLAFARALAGVGVPESNTELIPECEHVLNGSGVPLTAIRKETLHEDLETWISSTRADVVFMMTFPWRIPGAVLEKFPEQIFNFHYGILPAMRGADPVFESIRSRKEAGITVHLVTEGLDKGPMIFQQKLVPDELTTHGLLCARLGAMGAQICHALLPVFADRKQLVFHPQPETEAKYYSRPGLKDVAINWQMMDSADIHALVRACNPWNKGAYTSVKGWNIRICGLSYAEGEQTGSPGTIIRADEESGVIVACRDGKGVRIDTIYAEEGIFEGKKLIQFGIATGDRLINVI
jgi:methionyl-tRNA formyltransferase